MTSPNRSAQKTRRSVSPSTSPVLSKWRKVSGDDTDKLRNESGESLDRSCKTEDSLASLFTSVATMLGQVNTPALPGQVPVLSLGCPLLDLALGGGLRRGGLTEVVGESSAGKTQFCLHSALQVAIRGEGVVYLHSEGGFPQSRLDQMTSVGGRQGSQDRILVHKVRDMHHLLTVLRGDVLEQTLVTHRVGLVVVDSVAAVVRYEGDLTTALDRAGVVHKLGQALSRLVGSNDQLAVLAVNQVTDRFDQPGYSPPERRSVASLGQAWAQYPHTRLWLTKTKFLLGNTEGTVKQGLKAETRLRKLEVDFSCRLAASSSHFVVEEGGIKGIRVN